MSNALRDMYVGINFRDDATTTLTRMNTLFNQAENHVQYFGQQLNRAENHFQSFGQAGINALLPLNHFNTDVNDVENNVQQLGQQLNNTQHHFQSFGQSGTTSLNHFNTVINSVKNDVRQLGQQLNNTENHFKSFGRAVLSASLRLIQFNTVVNSVKNNVQQLGHQLNSAQHHLQSFGHAGTGALTQINIHAPVITQIFNHIENQVEDTTKEVKQLDYAFVNMGFSATVAGTAILGTLSAGTAATTPLVTSVVGLASSFAAAGIGAVAFGAVAISVLGSVFEASEEVAKLEEKIVNADNAKERMKAQKELTDYYADMNKEQKGALKSLQGFKSFWGDFVQQFEAPIFGAFAVGLEGAEKILTHLSPTISNVADVVNEMMNGLNQSLDGSGATKFFSWLETNAAESLRSFALIGGNTLSGLFGVLQAFAPIGASMEEGLIGLTATFKEWGNSLEDSEGFKSFISYAQENGPKLMGIIGDVGTIAKQLITDLAPFGSTALTGIQSFTSLIVDNWGTVGDLLISVATGFAAMKVVSVVGALLTAYKGSAFAATLATSGLNAALRANPIGLVVTAVGLLVTAGVYLYRNWDTVKTKAGELWATTKEKFAGIKQSVSDFVQPAIGWFESIGQKWDNFKSSLSNFKMPEWATSLGGVIGKAAGVVGNLVSGSHATGLERVPYDGYVAELHRGEAVLTAQQSNALRSAGILSQNSDGTPELNMGGGGTTQPAPATGSGGHQFIFYITGDNSQDIAQKVREALSDILGEELQIT